MLVYQSVGHIFIKGDGKTRHFYVVRKKSFIYGSRVMKQPGFHEMQFSSSVLAARAESYFRYRAREYTPVI